MPLLRRSRFPAYFLVSAVVFYYTSAGADNPDTFSYLNIARQWLEGKGTVNGYWSPLISVLVLLPLKISGDGILSFKVLQVIIGAIALRQWLVLVRKTNVPSVAAEFFPIPFLVFYGQLNLTPDLLFLTIALTLLNRSMNTAGSSSLVNGLLGGLLFLTKAFGLPFFIVWTIVSALINKVPLRKALNTVIIGCAVSLPWIMVMSLHYGEPVISKAAQFNASVDVAPLPGRGNELPVLSGGIYTPEKGSVSAWETPGNYVSKQQVGLFSAPEAYWQVVKRNLLTIWYYDFRRQPGMLFLFALLILLIFRRNVLGKKEILLSLFMMVTLYVGYSLILVHTRYVWLCSWLIFYVLFFVIVMHLKLTRQMKIAALSVLILFFWKRPYKEILFTEDKDLTLFQLGMSIRHPLETMEVMYHRDVALSGELSMLNSYGLKGNLVQLKNDPSHQRDNYTEALRLAFVHRLTFLGSVHSASDVPTQADLLMSYKPLELPGYTLLFSGHLFSIYSKAKI